MDRRRRRARALALFATLATGSAALAADVGPPLRAMRWVPATADPARAVATAPAECLLLPRDRDALLSVEVGRAAFRTPVLLGGQAARAGLSCENCHRAGRDNPDFQFPGASGDPGTADVTLSLFSSHRGNGIHDPKPIPDLAGPRDKLKVAPADLPKFIHGLIVEEFDGPEPTPTVLNGLADYVRALQPAACRKAARVAVTASTLLDDARRALGAARAELARGDRPTAVVMIAAARARLGLIDERYADQSVPRERLRAADAALADLQSAVRQARPDAPATLDKWLVASHPFEAALRADEPRSLFNPARLSQAANRRLPAEPS